MTARLVVLASGGGSNLQAVIDACASGSLDAQVVAVVSDRPQAFALERAQRAGLTHLALTRQEGEARTDYDRRLRDAVAAHRPDWVVLAGWMRILTMSFLGGFPGRVVNLHPALPGELPGTHAIERAHAEAVEGRRDHTGVMVHLVPDEGVDDGPVLASERIALTADESLSSLEARVHAVEHRLLVDTLRTLVAVDATATPPTAPNDLEVTRP